MRLGPILCFLVIPWAVFPETAVGNQSPTGNQIEQRTLKSWAYPDSLLGEWVLMAGRNQNTTGCLNLMPKTSGPIIRSLPFRQKALDVTSVDIVLDQEASKNVSGMRLFWARQADSERDEKWPFSNERSAPFYLVTGEDGEQRWRADIAFHGNWIGTISEMFIGATVPDDVEPPGVSLCIREISLQEEIWMSEDMANTEKEN